jgi:hypothetical protein
MPDPLRAVYELGDGRFRDDGQWWVVWPLDRVVNENERSWAEDQLPRTLLAFGDDGTGNPFCVSLGEDADEVSRWSWIDSEVVESEGRMRHFLEQWAGGH